VRTVDEERSDEDNTVIRGTSRTIASEHECATRIVSERTWIGNGILWTTNSEQSERANEVRSALARSNTSKQHE
jgi:hypothetical protein